MNKDAVDCALAGIRAVDPRQIVQDALARGALTLQQATGLVSVVSIGKAAGAMAHGAVDVLGGRAVRGVVVAPTRVEALPESFETYAGGHPIPNAQGERGARAVLALVESLGHDDILLCLISGGASALMMLPANGVALADVQDMTNLLLRAGATITELNCVRKHVDRLKGGRLARAATPARTVALILSDVIGDPIDVISSGPTVPDPTTVADAIRVLKTRQVWDTVAPAIRDHLTQGRDESPKPGDPCFETATSTVIGNNTKAARAACNHAQSLGYDTSLITTTLMGEAREQGEAIAQHAIVLQADMPSGATPRCLVYAGETTVTVMGTGLGGRNQELALAAAIVLDGHPGITLTSIGTDGIDGPTDAAGAVADGTTIARSRNMGHDAHRALMNNDAYHFWQALGDLIIIGSTGTNVMDLMVVTIAPL